MQYSPFLLNSVRSNTLNPSGLGHKKSSPSLKKLASSWKEKSGSFILAHFCGSFNKLNTYFLQSLNSSLFFRKLIFDTVPLPQSVCSSPI